MVSHSGCRGRPTTVLTGGRNAAARVSNKWHNTISFRRAHKGQKGGRGGSMHSRAPRRALVARSCCRQGTRGEAEAGGAWEVELVGSSLSVASCLSGVDEVAAATAQ
jgi:hypothetical protein